MPPSPTHALTHHPSMEMPSTLMQAVRFCLVLLGCWAVAFNGETQQAGGWGKSTSVYRLQHQSRCVPAAAQLCLLQALVPTWHARESNSDNFLAPSHKTPSSRARTRRRVSHHIEFLVHGSASKNASPGHGKNKCSQKNRAIHTVRKLQTWGAHALCGGWGGCCLLGDVLRASQPPSLPLPCQQ